MKDNGDKARKKVVFLGDSITEGCCACCPENIFHALKQVLLSHNFSSQSAGALIFLSMMISP